MEQSIGRLLHGPVIVAFGMPRVSSSAPDLTCAAMSREAVVDR